MVQGRWISMDGDLSEPLALRKQVFGREADGLDAMAQHVVVYEDGQPVGAARLWWQDGAFWLGDVGVLAEKRGRGFGDLLIRLGLFKALTHQAREIRLTAPAGTEAFFARYGFQREGNGCMSILAQDVHLSHCGGNCAECSHPSGECVPKAFR